MYRFLLMLCAVLSLSACGGGETSSVSFQTLTIFTDNAGIASGKGSDGTRMYYMAPNIVADVAGSNASDSSPNQVDVSSFPIISREQGYNLRQGAIDGVNIVIAEKIGTDKASIAYLYDNYQDALAVGTAPLVGTPSGSHTYNGLYVVGQRGTGWAEYGAVTLQADFNSGTFSINASSDDTSLSGSGFIEVSSGQVSGSNLVFNDVDYGTYDATTLGLIGGANGSEIVGLWYTNESDGNPDFAGGYATSR